MRPRVRFSCEWSVCALGLWIEVAPDVVFSVHVGPLVLDVVWPEAV